ncbi:unnamed protein product [Pleuronectes platessa]|uniref:Uncharacterized protein n=1 Tax=Pleuronectes platessa TaxID=8262 RepID=A0A9N7UR62_PLEPL|nr:unnamed protein product [Pleuronectes platessa]
MEKKGNPNHKDPSHRSRRQILPEDHCKRNEEVSEAASLREASECGREGLVGMHVVVIIFVLLLVVLFLFSPSLTERKSSLTFSLKGRGSSRHTVLCAYQLLRELAKEKVRVIPGSDKLLPLPWKPNRHPGDKH